MRFIKKTALARAVRVPLEDNSKSMFQHGKVIGLFASIQFTNFRVTHEKGYEIFLPDRKLMANPGDWIVSDGPGRIEVYTAEKFSEAFEPG